MATLYRCGFGCAEITAYERGMGLLGWGRPHNVALGVAEPLFARAALVEDPAGEGRVAYVCADLCFISGALRQAVLDRLREARARLRLDARSVMLTATHTHSGPSGFSDAFFYELACPGISAHVLDTIADGIVSAIALAHDRVEPARLTMARVRIPCAERIAFNRSLEAYLRNPEARRAPRAGADRAVDRTMTLLAAHDARGRATGALAFFALHATSIHGDSQRLHSDSRGLAAGMLERWARAHGAAHGFVAAFPQGAAGDVTPNHRFDPRRGVTVGAFDDDTDSAAHVARVLSGAAASLLAQMPEAGEPLGGPVGGALAHHDFGPRATLGVGMAAGTAEGPGPLGRLSFLLRGRAARGPGDKRVLLEVGPGRRDRFFGRLDPIAIPLASPVLEHARRARENGGGVDELPWVPTVLPLALLRIGQLAVAGLPNEPTTVAGARIARALAAVLRPRGVTHVHVQGYANDYAGYLTTPEEYALQRYEGAYTLFGAQSLDAFTRALVALAREPQPHGEPPSLALCSPAQRAARRFAG